MIFYIIDQKVGDLLIRGFWATVTTCCILDEQVYDADAKSYCKRNPAKVLPVASPEKEKKRKYLEACLIERLRHFTPFVCSADGMLGHPPFFASL
jgi:hypothetical protein